MTKWYIRKNGMSFDNGTCDKSVSGPFSGKQMHMMAANRQILATDEISNDKKSWVRFGTTGAYRDSACFLDGSPDDSASGSGNWRKTVAVVVAVLVVLLVGILVVRYRPSLSEFPSKDTSSVEQSAASDDYKEIFPKLPGSIRSYLEPTAGEMETLLGDLKYSPYIRENGQYAPIAERVTLVFDPDADEVNAYAGKDGDGWRIVLCGGLVRLSRLFGSVLAIRDEENGGPSNDGEPYMDRMLAFARGKGLKMDRDALLSGMAMSGVFDDDGVGKTEWVAMARAVSRGVCAAVLGHELGHIMLGDNLQNLDWYNSQADTTGRQMERRADSFASSILGALYKEDEQRAREMFLGCILFHYALAVMGDVKPDDGEGNHPPSTERLLNFVRDHPKWAMQAGFTEENVVQKVHDAQVRLGFRNTEKGE